MVARRWASAALVAAFALCAAVALVMHVGWPVAMYGKYDQPIGWTKNDMLDNSAGRIHSYSEGDRDTRERPFMTAKFDRLQSIIDSIHNGPAGNTVPIPPPPPNGPLGHNGPAGNTGPIPPAAPAKHKERPTLSYMQRIMKAIKGIQKRVNKAARRQYVLEDLASDAKKLVGKPGKPGAVGLPGLPGLRGDVGPPGKPGKDGKPGKPGEDNLQRGAPGPPGVVGPEGKDGFDGTPNFIAGPRGPRGPQGERGATGVPGVPGVNGVNGEDGKPGAQGEIGEPGPNGKDGTSGENGLPGPTGAVGKRGKDGLPGYPGPQGRADEQVGPPGPRGDQGLPGPEGAPGMTGQVGLRGPYGQRGPRGYPGLNGVPGEEGRMGISAGDVRVFGGSTVEGDKLCHFPFLHEGMTYTRCTSHGRDQPWCYVDVRRERWGYCDTVVPVLQGDSLPGDKCMFPYMYDDVMYTQCTPWHASPPPDAQSQSHEGVTWCFTDEKKTRYGICQQEVGGGTSEPGDVCSTPCRTDFSTRPWCYSAPDMSRWGVCLFKEARADGSFVWV